ncbi:transporter, major facilitator family protein [Prevotella sp. BV3P1]|uniref:MFS transporter n=1 Tax=Prevotellaceae TaxID=171552 RepID=UPI0003B894E0|nr:MULTISPECIES: MFS transporter [Prevotellaceae]ERT59360.1 transporter, major facilitator family protein [Prevotella sp. BV3P1]
MEENYVKKQMTNFRWIICAMLFLATAINYMDRQALSLTWKDFIAPEFHWTNTDYGNIAAAFSIVYAIANLFSGRIIDWLGTKKGYLWAIGIWSVGACLHALCGWATEQVVGLNDAALLIGAAGATASTISMVSVYFFLAARVILAAGEAGNFPAAIKVTAEYFPKKDRAFATAIFNAGTTVGALIAPLTIPTLARCFKDMGVGNGWEMAFVVIGLLGFLWMGLWIFMYKDLDKNPHVNQAEREYILQDSKNEAGEDDKGRKIPVKECIKLRQTWAIVLGKFLTDGVWWFFLFWTPAYISDVYGYTSDSFMAQMLIFVLYAITMLSLFGGKLPTIFINRTGKDPYSCRMRAMLIFAVFPLLGLLAQPLGAYSCWLTIIIIGIVGAAHQSWSANLFSVGSDLFPKNTVATITGMNGMAGGISSFLINLGSGRLLDYVDATQLSFLGFQGKEAGYFMIFCYCSVAYLAGWSVMKSLVPKYKPVV